MVVDSHQHAFWQGRDDAGLVADMDYYQIDLAWLLTWEILPHEDDPAYHPLLNPIHRRADGTHAGILLQDLLLARSHFPGRFVVGYCPHPLTGNAAALFEAAHRVHGVRVCGEWKFRLSFDDLRCLEFFAVAGHLHCPVVLHLDVPYLKNASGVLQYQPSWYGGTVANLERALLGCPETIFIGHAPGFWREISGSAESDEDIYPAGPITEGGKLLGLLDRHDNLFADLSAQSALRALKRDPGFSLRFIERFANRLLFGRDSYRGELNEFLSGLGLSVRARERIYSENALSLVPISNR